MPASPSTTFVNRTERHLAAIRAGLLSPDELFARIVENFVSCHGGDAVHRASRCRAMSGGRRDALVEWTCDGGRSFVLARTRSEARAVHKRVTGKPIPAGVQFRWRDRKGRA